MKTSVVEDRLVERVGAAIVGCSGWSGWIRPEGLAHALALDIGDAGAEIGDALALTDETLRAAALHLDQALHGTGPSFELPFGSRVTVGRPGSVEIGGRVFVWRPHAPGLHAIEDTPRHVAGSTFESLRLMVGNWASSTNARRIGKPSPTTFTDGGVRHAIEFPPVPEAGGAVLQYDADAVDAARFCGAPVRSLEAFCKVVIKDLQWLWRHRTQIGRRVEEVREAAEAGIARADHYGTHAVVGRILIDGRSIGTADAPTLRIEYLGLDDSLRRGSLFERVAGHDVVDGPSMMRGPLVNRWRNGQVDLLRKLDADGWIDAAAAGIARQAAEGAAAVLARLARDPETVVALPAADGSRNATLFWHDGVIRAERHAAGGLARLWEVVDQRALLDRMAAEDAPLPMEAHLDLPAVGPGLAGGGTPRPAAHPGLSLVNTATGTIRPAPEDDGEGSLRRAID